MKFEKEILQIAELAYNQGQKNISVVLYALLGAMAAGPLETENLAALASEFSKQARGRIKSSK
jgi:hypothetical protein